jgi:hypothetical protein
LNATESVRRVNAALSWSVPIDVERVMGLGIVGRAMLHASSPQAHPAGVAEHSGTGLVSVVVQRNAERRAFHGATHRSHRRAAAPRDEGVDGARRARSRCGVGGSARGRKHRKPEPGCAAVSVRLSALSGQSPGSERLAYGGTGALPRNRDRGRWMVRRRLALSAPSVCGVNCDLSQCVPAALRHFEPKITTS